MKNDAAFKVTVTLWNDGRLLKPRMKNSQSLEKYLDEIADSVRQAIRDPQPVNHGVVEVEKIKLMIDEYVGLMGSEIGRINYESDNENTDQAERRMKHIDEKIKEARKFRNTLFTVTECKCGVMEKILKDASGYLDWVLGQYDCLPPHMKSEKTIERQENLKVLVAKIAALAEKEKK